MNLLLVLDAAGFGAGNGNGGGNGSGSGVGGAAGRVGPGGGAGAAYSRSAFVKDFLSFMSGRLRSTAYDPLLAQA